MQAGDVLEGKWKVLEPIGEGGVGSVWRGEHVTMGRAVAVKALHALFAAQPEFRKRFEREARAASKLNHPACVSVLDFGEHQGQLYLVMEYAAGQLLAERLDNGPMDPVDAVLISRGIAAALRHAHSLGIVHRDLKPGNVMLLDNAATGVPCKLLDFGLAKSVEGGENLTMTGTVFGTPGYLSPEQAQGVQADARSDLYSLGIMMWEMLAGDKPFRAADPIDVLRMHLTQPAPPVREFAKRASVQLERVVAKLLEKDPKQRFQTAEELMNALAKLPETRGVAQTEAVVTQPKAVIVDSSVHDPEPEPAPRRTSVAPTVPATPSALVRPWGVAAGSVLAIGLLVAAALYWRGERPAPAAEQQQPPPPPPKTTHMVLPPDPVALPSSSHVDPAAARHVAKGREFINRLWCPNGLQEYERAIEIDPTVRSDPRTTDEVVRCLESDHARAATVRFLAETIGPPAERRLRQIAGDGRNPQNIRRAAEDALARIR
jgi:serine/threonine-protein kinase